jgi:hypothetical protein
MLLGMLIALAIFLSVAFFSWVMLWAFIEDLPEDERDRILLDAEKMWFDDE